MSNYGCYLRYREPSETLEEYLERTKGTRLTQKDNIKKSFKKSNKKSNRNTQRIERRN